MAGPTVVGCLSSAGSGLSVIGLGGPPLTATVPTRSMPATGEPWIAHVYHNDWSFKATIDPLDGNQQPLGASLNGGFQPLTLPVAASPASTVCAPGDLITITEQGGDGLPIIGGIVEDLPDIADSQGQTSHGIAIAPFVAELADTGVELVYTVPTDVGRMVRDAVSKTAHCGFNFETIPDTGVLLPTSGFDPVQFTGAVAADVLNAAILMAGPTYSWFCDELGTVWFQPMASVADWSVTRGEDYTRRERSTSITNLKNHIPVQGGIPSGASAPVVATYDNPTSQASYGLRKWDPPPTYPMIADTATLQAIANTLGALFDRVMTKVILTLPRLAKRIQMGSIGGPTIRYFEPATDPLPGSSPGSGSFSNPFAVLGLQLIGIEQVVTAGDFPYATSDNWQYILERLLQRQVVAPLSLPAPTLSGHTVMQVGTVVGTGGRFTILYGSGQIALDVGTLPSYIDPSGVISSGGQGIRLLDPTGLILVDTGGHQQTGNNLGASGQGPGQVISATSYTTTSPAIQFSFTLARQTRCLFLGGAEGHIQAGAGLGYVRIAIYDNASVLVANTGDAKIGTGITNTLSSVGGIPLLTGANSVAAIGPGTYTAKLETKVDAGGTTMYFDNGALLGIGFGA